MKKKLLNFSLLTFSFAAVITVASLSFENTSHSAYAFSGGSPGGKTNSPGDAANCTQCHSGSLNPGAFTPTITSASLASGYTPGQTYTIAVGITGTSSTKIGFEATAEKDTDNSKTGTIIITDAARTTAVNSGTGATHTSAGNTATAGANAWTFDWVAPATGTGDITIYGAFNVTNNNGSTSGDQVYTTSMSVSELSTGIDNVFNENSISLYPNPVINNLTINSNKKIDKIEIYNSNGQLLINQTNTNQINFSQYNTGIYFVRIFKDNQSIYKKVIKK